VTVTEPGQGTVALGAIFASIKNTSEQPVYDLTVSWQRGTALWGEPSHIAVVMPGEQQELTEIPPTVDLPLFRVITRFRDSAGVYWRLRSDGQLDEEPVGQ